MHTFDAHFPQLSLFRSKNKLEEVGQEISAQKQKHSNMKSNGVWREGGKKGQARMGKRAGKRKRVLKLSLHYQQQQRRHTAPSFIHTRTEHDHS